MALEVDPPDLGRLRSELETAIFRIVQEALTNLKTERQKRQTAFIAELRQKAKVEIVTSH